MTDKHVAHHHNGYTKSEKVTGYFSLVSDFF